MIERLLLSVRRCIRRHTTRRSSTVRYAFPAVVVFSALLAALTLSPDASYVRVESVPSQVAAGETFTINVYAHAAIPTNAIDISLAYPEQQIAVERVDIGESVITIWTEDPYAAHGVVHMRGGVFRKGFLGEHLIARVKAHALSAGVAHVLASNSEFIAGDGKGSAVSVVNNGSGDTNIYVTKAGELKSTVSVGLVTDINHDGIVDLADVREFLAAWYAKQSIFDFNGDGKMTFRDFGILLARSFFH